MTEPLTDDELRHRWARTLGQGADWQRIDPAVTQKPVESGGTLSHLATVGGTMSGGLTLGGTLSGGATVRGGGSAAAPTPAGTGFEIIGEVGRGGMGVVYRAKQRSLAREIALKFIRPEQADQGAKERFVSEALVNGLLDHPNIVPVHELGANEQGEVYLAMKLVGGRSWKALLHPHTPEERAAAAPYDLDKHLAVLQGVGNAVAFAHSRGIVHRDLKPENVMVGEFGEVLVMDWGIAVDIRDAPDGDQRAQHKSTVTAPSGTPSYMAPELAEGRGKDIGAHTDVYLLGAILHEVLTGAPPHRGRTLMEVLLAAACSAPPAYDATVSAGLGEIAAQAMHRVPGQRFATVAEFQGAIARYLKHRESEKIAANARECLAGAEAMAADDATQRNRRYGAFAEAVAGFRQALVLWEGNAAAASGEREARLAYATGALAAGDLGLADAQLEALPVGIDGGLRDRIASARAAAGARDRAAKRNRWLLAGATVAIVVGLGVGFALVSAEQAATRKERDKAVAAESVAQSAQQRAENERTSAEVARTQAETAKVQAEEQRNAAQSARAEAQRSLVATLRQRANDDREQLALLWEAESLRAAIGNPQLELLERRRLAERFATQPLCTRVLHLSGGIRHYNRGGLSDDGRVGLLTITLSGHEQAQVYDFERLQPIGPDHGAAWRDLALHPDGKALIRDTAADPAQLIALEGRTVLGPTPPTAAGRGLEITWGKEEGATIRIAGREPLVLSGIGKVAFSSLAPDGIQALTANAEGKAILWALPGGTRLAEVQASGGVAETIWGAKRVLVRAEYSEMAVLDRVSGKNVASPYPLPAEGWSVSRCFLIGADEERVAISWERNKSFVVDVQGPTAGEETAAWVIRKAPLPGELTHLRERGAELRLLCNPETFGDSGYDQVDLIVLDWRPPTAPVAVRVAPDPDALAASADGAVVVVASGGRIIRLRGADRTPIGLPVSAPEAKQLDLVVSGDGTRYAVAADGRITVHAVPDGAAIGTAWQCPYAEKNDDGSVANPVFALSHDGKRVVARVTWTAIRWWECDSGREGKVDQTALGATSADVVITGDYRITRPWLTDDRPILLQVPPRDSLQVADISRDGSLMLSVTGFKADGNYARVWDLATGKARSEVLRFQMYPIGGAFTPDGTRFAVSVCGLGVRVYDCASGEMVTRPLDTGGADGSNLGFNADGSIVRMSGNGEQWWDVATGEGLRGFSGASAVASYAMITGGERVPCFLPDGSCLLSDGHIERLPEAGGRAEHLVALAGILTAARIDRSGAPIRLLPKEYADAWTAYQQRSAEPRP